MSKADVKKVVKDTVRDWDDDDARERRRPNSRPAAEYAAKLFEAGVLSTDTVAAKEIVDRLKATGAGNDHILNVLNELKELEYGTSALSS